MSEGNWPDAYVTREDYLAVSAERDALKAKLDAASRAEAEMRTALESYATCSDGCTCGDGWSHVVALRALASDAGHDYVPPVRAAETVKTGLSPGNNCACAA